MALTEKDVDYHRLPFRLMCRDHVRKRSPVGMLGGGVQHGSPEIKARHLKVSDRETLSLTRVLRRIGCDPHVSYVKSGAYGHTFRTHWRHPEDPTTSIPVAIKVVAYSKKGGEVNHETRAENAEIKILQLLSDMVSEGETPHITLPYITFKAPLKQFLFNPKDLEQREGCKKYLKFLNNSQNMHDEVSVLMSEWCNGGDLSGFIKKYNTRIKLETWRNILFQVLASLAAVHRRFPDFRHNDLKANNILVTLLRRKDPDHYNVYSFGPDPTPFLVQSEGVMLKLWDFDFACIPDMVHNEKVDAEWTSTRCNISRKKNQYYDMHYFFCTLTMFYDRLMKDGAPEEVKLFVRRMLPKEYRLGKTSVSERGRLMVDHEVLTPTEVLLTDSFFEPYRRAGARRKATRKR